MHWDGAVERGVIWVGNPPTVPFTGVPARGGVPVSRVAVPRAPWSRLRSKTFKIFRRTGL
jgi:hypothetical protein